MLIAQQLAMQPSPGSSAVLQQIAEALTANTAVITSVPTPPATPAPEREAPLGVQRPVAATPQEHQLAVDLEEEESLSDDCMADPDAARDPYPAVPSAGPSSSVSTLQRRALKQTTLFDLHRAPKI
eukprot:10658375-Lingulodinium_polyedra.AAC.1